MVVQPHLLDIDVNDTDNATLKANVNVYIVNTSKGGTKLENDQQGNKIVTDSSGNVLIDVANLPIGEGQTLEYDQGDKILIIAYDGVNSDAFLYTVQGEEFEKTLNLNPVPHTGPRVDTARLMAILGANTTSTVAFAKIYSINDGELLAHLEVPGDDSRSHLFGAGWGKGASGGFIVERQANTLVVTITER